MRSSEKMGSSGDMIMRMRMMVIMMMRKSVEESGE